MIDFSGLISQLLSTYWWLVPLLIVAALFKSAKQDLTPIFLEEVKRLIACNSIVVKYICLMGIQWN